MSKTQIEAIDQALAEIDEVFEKLQRVRKSFRSFGGELRCDDVEMKLEKVQAILREAFPEAPKDGI